MLSVRLNEECRSSASVARSGVGYPKILTERVSNSQLGITTVCDDVRSSESAQRERNASLESFSMKV